MVRMLSYTLHMMSGKAVQRAFRGHLLADQCLTCQIVAKIVEDDPGFQDQVGELERLYMLIETGKCDLGVIVGIRMRSQNSQHSNS